jgi:hypothetical protein
MGRDFDTGAQALTLGYDRAAVDAFLAAAAEERQKLETEIEQSNMRLARARTALGTHRVMVAMLLETQRELSVIRRDAERQAAEIIAAAEREMRAAPGDRLDAPSAGPATDAIDLRSDPEPSNRPSGDLPVRPSTPEADGDDALFAPAGQDDAFFQYLRGALSDDEPLGPRPEAEGIR